MTAPHLLSPVTFAGQELKNRMVLAPLTRGRAGPDRVPNKIMGDYYVQRPSGGLLISEASVVAAHIAKTYIRTSVIRAIEAGEHHGAGQ